MKTLTEKSLLSSLCQPEVGALRREDFFVCQLIHEFIVKEFQNTRSTS